jgi:P pilus assembly chaperone PapD
VYLQEVDTARNDATGAQVRTLLRAGIPLLTMTQSGLPDVRFTVERTPAGAVLTVRNVGTHFVTLRDFTLTTVRGSTTRPSLTVLAGGVMHVPLQDATVDSVDVTYLLDGEPRRLTVPGAR